VLAAENVRDLRSKAADDARIGVDDEPLPRGERVFT
jgi:hypothetical protein